MIDGSYFDSSMSINLLEPIFVYGNVNLSPHDIEISRDSPDSLNS